MGSIPGGTWTGDGSTFGSTLGGSRGSGDVAQNLLPVLMKIAAQTIGLDLVAVKPTSSPRIELLFVDFKYDNNSDYNTTFGEKDERPLVFKMNCTNLTALQADLHDTMTLLGITELVGGLSNRMFVHLSGGTQGVYFNNGLTPRVPTITQPDYSGYTRCW